MEQRRIERDSFRLKNAESIILELGLLAYPLLLISESTRIGPHYLIIGLAIIVGVVTYFLYDEKLYSIVHGLLISLLIVFPLYLVGLPLSAVILIYVYVYWRLHVNLSLDRGTRWNFLAINTIIFTAFYFITRVYLLKNQAAEFNKVNILLFLVLTLLFIVLRYIAIGLLGRQQADFKMGETNKVFAAIIGAGVVTYLMIIFLIEHLRTAIINLFTFVFGGIFMIVSTAITPFIEYVIEYLDYLRYKAFQEMEPPELGYVEFQMEEKSRFLVGAEADLRIYLFIGGMIIAVIALLLILRKRKQAYEPSEVPMYKIWSSGRNNKSQLDDTPVYDYSEATNAVRDAYQQFELEAQHAKNPRFIGETVKEWFIRMDWAKDEALFLTYDKARYGSLTISEEDARQFIDALNKIKTNYFSKDV